VATLVTVESEEAVGEYATAQVCAELLLDEAGGRLIARGQPGEEALELLADDLV